MRYIVEMRIPVIVDTEDLEELGRTRDSMRETAVSHGWVPRFLASEEWRWNAQFQKPRPFNASRGRPESEHVRREP